MRASRVLRASAPLAFAGLALLAIAAACDKNSSGPDQPGVQPDAPIVSAEQSTSEAPATPVTAEPAAVGDDTATSAATMPSAAEAAPTGSSENKGEVENAGGSSEGNGQGKQPTAQSNNTNNTNKTAKNSTKRALPAPIFGKGKSGCGRDPGIGKPIKSFSLKTTKGKTISSANLKGRVVLLNFWGTWCKPCLKELPEFDRLYRRYRKNGLLLLAIATDSDPEPVLALAKERKLAAKIAIGGEELANSYKSPSFPFSFVVDKKGIIRASYRGFKPECLGQLEQDIRAQLAD